MFFLLFSFVYTCLYAMYGGTRKPKDNFECYFLVPVTFFFLRQGLSLTGVADLVRLASKLQGAVCLHFSALGLWTHAIKPDFSTHVMGIQSLNRLNSFHSPIVCIVYLFSIDK